MGANKDRFVTKVASMGMWAPVHRDEWDDETPLEAGTQMIDSQSGEVVFRGGTLPWKTGNYEVRWLCVRLFGLIQLGLDPLSSRWEIQRHHHSRADRSIR